MEKKTSLRIKNKNNDYVFDESRCGFDVTPFKDLNIGDVLEYRKSSVLQRLGMDKKYADVLQGQEIVYDKNMYDSIIISRGEVFHSFTLQVTDDDGNNMWEAKLESPFSMLKVKKLKSKKYASYNVLSKFSKNKIKATKAEMISKVDKVKLKGILKCYYNGDITDIGVDGLLDIWADKKMYMYVAMGNNISIAKKVEYIPNHDDLVTSAKRMIRRYADTLSSDIFSNRDDYVTTFYASKLFEHVISSCNDAIDNKITLSDFKIIFSHYFLKSDCGHVLYDKYLENYDKMYKRIKDQETKVTKVFGKIFGQTELDNVLSQIYQNAKKKHHDLYMSIDPIDIFTCSISSTWQSCHRPQGCYSCGPISYAIDDSTIIFFSKGEKFKSNYLNGMEHESKKWRMLAYVNKETFTANFYREYPCNINNLANTARNFYEEVISKFLGVKNSWEYSNEYYGNLSNVSGLHYNDILHFGGERSSDKHLYTIFLPNVDVEKITRVGSHGVCLKCGKALTDRSDSAYSHRTCPTESSD